MDKLAGLSNIEIVDFLLNATKEYTLRHIGLGMNRYGGNDKLIESVDQQSEIVNGAKIEVLRRLEEK